MEKVFSFNNYKEYITYQIDAHSSIRGYRSRLAEAAGIQRTYLSQALHGHVELTPEHAMALAEFWNMKKEETDYFLLLLHYSRAGTPKLREHILHQMKSLKAQHEDLEKQLNSPKISNLNHEVLYYSNWIWTALHAIVSLSEFPTPSKIAKATGLPVKLILTYLKELQRMGLVNQTRGQWQSTQKKLHLSKRSASVWNHHYNWRAQALENAKKNENAESSLHYTSLHMLSLKDFQHLQKKIHNFLLEVQELVDPSPEEDVVCLNIDLFSIIKR